MDGLAGYAVHDEPDELVCHAHVVDARDTGQGDDSRSLELAHEAEVSLWAGSIGDLDGERGLPPDRLVRRLVDHRDAPAAQLRTDGVVPE